MENSSVNNHTDLTNRILYLKAEEDRLEGALRDAVIQYVSALNPVAIAKRSIHDLARDKQVQWDLVKISVVAGVGFFAERLTGKKLGIAGNIGSVLGKTILSVFLNGKLSSILKNNKVDNGTEVSEPAP